MNDSAEVLAELRERGSFGLLGLDYLRGLARSVVEQYNFRAPNGAAWWSDEDLGDVVHDWVFDRDKGEARVRKVLAAVDEPGRLRRYLRAALRNHLRSMGRKTEFGARLRAVRKHVEHDARFVTTSDPDTYALREHAGRPLYAGDDRLLVEAAARVAVVLLRYETQERRQPIATDETIVGIVFEVLSCAQAPLMEDVVVHIVLNRCGVAWKFEEIEFLPDEEDHDRDKFDGYEVTEVSINVVISIADTVWAALDDTERLLLHTLVDEDMTLDRITTEFGIARSTAGRRLKKLKERLVVLFVSDGPNAAAALADLVGRSRGRANEMAEAGVASLTEVDTSS